MMNWCRYELKLSLAGGRMVLTAWPGAEFNDLLKTANLHIMVYSPETGRNCYDK